MRMYCFYLVATSVGQNLKLRRTREALLIQGVIHTLYPTLQDLNSMAVLHTYTVRPSLYSYRTYSRGGLIENCFFDKTKNRPTGLILGTDLYSRKYGIYK